MSKRVVTESEMYRLSRAIQTYLHDTYGTIEEWKEACKVIREYFEIKQERKR